MAAHKHAIMIAAILLIAAVFAAACGNSTKNAGSSNSALQQSESPSGATPQPDAGRAYIADEYQPAEKIDTFTLTDQDGKPFQVIGGSGKVRLLYFGYTSCPDICPTTLANWRTVKKQLGDAASEVQFIMVTVDPDVDVPAEMKRWVGLFDPAFVGLSGTVDELTAVWHAFGVHPQRLELPTSATTHSISHSSAVYVLDKDGFLRLKIPFTEKPDEAAQDILRLMNQPS
jgi:protein SCO1/2